MTTLTSIIFFLTWFPRAPKPRRPARDEANGRIIAAFSTKTAFTFTTSTTTVPYTCISGALPTAVCTKRRLRRTVPIGDLRAGAEYVLLLFPPSLIFSFYLFSFLFVFFFDFSFYLFFTFFAIVLCVSFISFQCDSSFDIVMVIKNLRNWLIVMKEHYEVLFLFL